MALPRPGPEKGAGRQRPVLEAGEIADHVVGEGEVVEAVAHRQDGDKLLPPTASFDRTAHPRLTKRVRASLNFYK